MDATAPELTVTGSSPRGRGKLYKVCVPCIARRLIPAWAGKTRCPSRARRLRAAHPRVGGENTRGAGRRSSFAGSSPRGRGKREGDAAGCGRVGLIPAWAGKTKAGRVPQNERWAHPRVGGENVSVVAFASLPGGSSPRGRGKPVSAVLVGPSGRLIPAWAGKTSASTGRTQRRRAHPRVGGENPHPLSSPSSFIRLIPAWAGKTGVSAGALEGVQAHPRVGGENAYSARLFSNSAGSSPRGR